LFLSPLVSASGNWPGRLYLAIIASLRPWTQ
jgi:hypothetical protein